jgi:Cu/Ag efflux protein CusF
MAPRTCLVLPLLTLMLMAACSRQTPQEVKRYPLTGKVVSTDAKTSQVVVDHTAIPGFMDAMTMGYKVKDTSVLKSLVPGDEISAEVVVQGMEYWLENVRVTKKSATAPSAVGK